MFKGQRLTFFLLIVIFVIFGVFPLAFPEVELGYGDPTTTALLSAFLLLVSVVISQKNVREKAQALDSKVKELQYKNIILEDARKTMTYVLDNLNVEKAKDEALLASIGDGMIAIDSAGRIIVINQAAEEMIGWENKDVINKLISDIVPVEDEKGTLVPIDRRPIELALALGKKVTAVHYFVGKDKTKFPAAVTASPIFLRNKLTGAILTFRDITKETEIDRAKSEFVSLASHQLRTPLSTISWYAEMLLAGDVGKITKEQAKYLDEIYKANRRMVELVSALLNVSRIDLGTLATEPQPTNFLEVADSVLAELLPQIKANGIKIIKSYSKDLPLLKFDPKFIRIVFQNLLSNAVKYTPNNGEVILEIRKQDPDVFIKVADNGYGIPKAQQSKIFTKLFRADNIKEKDPEGTGLGLYIVKAIVEKAGGTIRFESEENKGTVFYIVLPLKGMEKSKGIRSLI